MWDRGRTSSNGVGMSQIRNYQIPVAPDNFGRAVCLKRDFTLGFQSILREMATLRYRLLIQVVSQWIVDTEISLERCT